MPTAGYEEEVEEKWKGKREEGRRMGERAKKKVRKGNPKQSATVPGTVSLAALACCCAAVLRLSVATHSLELALIDC